MENTSSSLLPVIDIHTHLAGLGHGDTNCFIAPKKFHSLLYRLMRWKLGIYRAHKEGRLDQAYLERLDRDIHEAVTHRALHAVVVFPHERIYTDSGELSRINQELYVPNEYAFACAERAEVFGRMLPAMSIHPYRPDAIDESLRWIERGAVAMKWLPNSQNIDPRDKRCLPLYRILADKKIPLIAHTGGEHTVSIIRPDLGDPDVLKIALDSGVTVVMAHCGSKSGFFDGQWLPQFCKLAQQYPNCWGDTSAFCTPGRARWVKRLLREEGAVAKLIHGSDYPVPPSTASFLFSLGWKKTRSLSQIGSFLERDVKIKRSLGFPDSVFTNAAKILAPGSLERWKVGPPAFLTNFVW